jgi:all-trans-8'-apo-beta-carotenal 15,15'-oxygenase
MTQSFNNLSRRDFAKFLFGASALALIETSTVSKVFAQTKRSMHWLSAQTASSEGIWTNLKVEGKIPNSLSGTLFRTAPGETERFGVNFNHLFDGDAFLSSWKFNQGKVELKAKFLNTPQRIKEQNAKQMIYSEFGTNAPKSQGGKNQPSVNVIEWNSKLLGLSEGGLPTVINPNTFDYEGETNFGSVPNNLTFTAHPRIDAKTGDLFAWGFEKGPSGKIRIYQIERKNNKANLLYDYSPKGYFMIHDAILTENYFVLIIPPMKYDIQGLMSGKVTNMGEAVKFAENEPTRFLAFPRNNQNGAAKPIEVELPAQMIFHYGNAHETADNKIVFEVVWGKDGDLLKVLNNWKREKFSNQMLKNLSPAVLQRVTVDLTGKKLVGTSDLVEDVEFPRFDLRLTGQKSRFIYAAERGYGENAAIVRVDLQSGKHQKAFAGNTRTFGEPVFVPTTSAINEERGLILTQGYDSDKNESFLEIRDAQTLDFASRIWANGQHFPLGFHGNFYAGI